MAQAVKVVEFTRKPNGRKIVTVPDDVMRRLRWDMHGPRAVEIAEDLNLSPGCIYAIKSGRTKWPRPATLFALLEYFGWKLEIVRK